MGKKHHSKETITAQGVLSYIIVCVVLFIFVPDWRLGVFAFNIFLIVSIMINQFVKNIFLSAFIIFIANTFLSSLFIVISSWLGDSPAATNLDAAISVFGLISAETVIDLLIDSYISSQAMLFHYIVSGIGIASIVILIIAFSKGKIKIR